jgi:ABC-type sugar transport system permease subunit
MTPKGGPLYSTAVMVFYIYEQAFARSQMGRAAAAAVILFIVVLVITQIQKLIGNKNVFYD